MRFEQLEQALSGRKLGLALASLGSSLHCLLHKTEGLCQDGDADLTTANGVVLPWMGKSNRGELDFHTHQSGLGMLRHTWCEQQQSGYDSSVSGLSVFLKKGVVLGDAQIFGARVSGQAALAGLGLLRTAGELMPDGL